jgi:hypothetical protein
MSVAEASENEEPIARLVVPLVGGPWSAAEGVLPADSCHATADKTGNVGRSLSGAQAEPHGVDVVVRLKGVGSPRREGPQPLVAHSWVAQVEKTSPIVVPAVRLRRGPETLGALKIEDRSYLALESRHAPCATVLRIVGACFVDDAAADWGEEVVVIGLLASGLAR